MKMKILLILGILLFSLQNSGTKHSTVINQGHIQPISITRSSGIGLDVLSSISATAHNDLIEGFTDTTDQYILISGWNNVTVRSNTIKSNTATFALYAENLDNLTIESNTFYNVTNTVSSVMGIHVKNATNVLIKDNTISDLLSIDTYSIIGIFIEDCENVTIQNSDLDNSYDAFYTSSAYTGIKVINSQNVTITQSSVSNIAAKNKVIAFDISSSDNVTLDNAVNDKLASSDSNSIGLKTDTVNNLFINNIDFTHLASLSDSFDFGNARTIYGMEILGGTNISISNSDIKYIYSTVDINLFDIISVTNLTLSNNLFFDIRGNTISSYHLQNVMNPKLLSIDIYYIQSTQYKGIHLVGCTGNTNITYVTTYSVSANSQIQSLILENTDNVILDLVTSKYLYSTSTSFDSMGIKILNSNNVVIKNAYMYYIYAYSKVSFGIVVVGSSHVNITSSKIYFMYSYVVSGVGIYITTSNNIIVNNTLFYYIRNTGPKSYLDSIDIPGGYGIVIDTSDTIRIQSNNIINVDNWIDFDDTVINLVLVENTIDSNPSALETIIRPSDVTYDISTTFVPISWTATTNPSNATGNYTILLNGEVQYWSNWTSGESILYTPNVNFTLGVYFVQIIFTEKSGFNTTDNVVINAVETSKPIMTQTNYDQVMALGINKTLYWTAVDFNPDTYSIYRNDIEFKFDYWESSVPVWINLMDTPLGDWNLTIVFRDTSGNEVSQTVMISVVELVDLTFESTTSDSSFTYGEQFYLNFSVSSVNPGNWSLTMNGDPYMTGEWEPSVLTSVNLTSLPVGNYMADLVVVDEFQQTISFEVEITVISPPVVQESEGFFEGLAGNIGEIIDEPIFSQNLPYLIGTVVVFSGVGIWQRRRLSIGLKAAGKTASETASKVANKAKKTTKKTTSKKTTSKKTTAKKTTSKKSKKKE